MLLMIDTDKCQTKTDLNRIITLLFMRASSFLKSTGFEYWIGVSYFFKFSFGGTFKGQVIRVSLFDTVGKRFGV